MKRLLKEKMNPGRKGTIVELIKILRVKDGDTVVFKLKRPMPSQQTRSVILGLQEVFSSCKLENLKFMVLEDRIDIVGVLRKEVAKDVVKSERVKRRMLREC